jgi:integrase
MSENILNLALSRMGSAADEMVSHGFRAMARSLLDETLKVRPDIVERQLAHTLRDPLGRASNRTTHIEKRNAANDEMQAAA